MSKDIAVNETGYYWIRRRRTPSGRRADPEVAYVDPPEDAVWLTGNNAPLTLAEVDILSPRFTAPGE